MMLEIQEEAKAIAFKPGGRIFKTSKREENITLKLGPPQGLRTTFGKIQPSDLS